MSVNDSVLRALDKDNGGGYMTRRQIIDALYDVKSGSKTALKELMSRLNWEDANESRYKISTEIAESRLGRKISAS